MSIAYKQEVEMWWQAPNIIFKEVCDLEYKRSLVTCSGINRVTRTLYVCVWMCKYYFFGQLLLMPYLPVESIVIFFQDGIGFLLLFVWQLFTKCWNHSSPSRCSLTSTDTFYSNPFFLLRDVIFKKKIISAPKSFML